MNSEQFELLTTIFLLNLAAQKKQEKSDENDHNANFKSLISGVAAAAAAAAAASQSLEPPTPPRTPASSSAASSKEETKPPTITLTPTSKLLAENFKQEMSTASDAEEDGMKSYSDMGSATFDHFNDSNDSGSDQADSNHSYDSRFSYGGKKIMDKTSPPTPLVNSNFGAQKNRYNFEISLRLQPFLSPLLHLAQLQGEAGEKQLSGEFYSPIIIKTLTY